MNKGDDSKEEESLVQSAINCIRREEIGKYYKAILLKFTFLNYL